MTKKAYQYQTRPLIKTHVTSTGKEHCSASNDTVTGYF